MPIEIRLDVVRCFRCSSVNRKPNSSYIRASAVEVCCSTSHPRDFPRPAVSCRGWSGSKRFVRIFARRRLAATHVSIHSMTVLAALSQTHSLRMTVTVCSQFQSDRSAVLAISCRASSSLLDRWTSESPSISSALTNLRTPKRMRFGTSCRLNLPCISSNSA